MEKRTLVTRLRLGRPGGRLAPIVPIGDIVWLSGYLVEFAETNNQSGSILPGRGCNSLSPVAIAQPNLNVVGAILVAEFQDTRHLPIPVHGHGSAMHF